MREQQGPRRLLLAVQRQRNAPREERSSRPLRRPSLRGRVRMNDLDDGVEQGPFRRKVG